MRVMKHPKTRMSSAVKASLVTAGFAVVAALFIITYDVFLAMEAPQIQEGWVIRWMNDTRGRIERLESLQMTPCEEECN